MQSCWLIYYTNILHCSSRH